MCDIKIIAVAIKIPMGKIYSEDLPCNHNYVLNCIYDDPDLNKNADYDLRMCSFEGKFIYGYLLSDGSFVDRFEGMKVAVQADQLKEPPCAHAVCLFSYYLKENH